MNKAHLYESMKQAWIAANTMATHAEYEAAIRLISKRIGF